MTGRPTLQIGDILVLHEPGQFQTNGIRSFSASVRKEVIHQSLDCRSRQILWGGWSFLFLDQTRNFTRLRSFGLLLALVLPRPKNPNPARPYSRSVRGLQLPFN